MRKGFTLMELIIVIALFGLVVICFYIPSANYWYIEDTVEKELQITYPKAKILKTERNGFSNSVILFKNGTYDKEICLNSSIFFNYEFVECD